jgi:hypothetical protein
MVIAFTVVGLVTAETMILMVALVVDEVERWGTVRRCTWMTRWRFCALLTCSMRCRFCTVALVYVAPLVRCWRR